MKVMYKDKLQGWLDVYGLDYILHEDDGNATLEIKTYKQKLIVHCITPFHEGMVDTINKTTKYPLLVLTRTATKKCFEQCKENGINLLTFEGNAYIKTPQMLINTYEERLRKPVVKTDVAQETVKELDEWQLNYESHSFKCTYDKESDRVTLYCEKLGANGSSGLYGGDSRNKAIRVAKEIICQAKAHGDDDIDN